MKANVSQSVWRMKKIEFEMGGKIFAFDLKKCKFVPELHAYMVTTESGATYFIPADKAVLSRGAKHGESLTTPEEDE